MKVYREESGSGFEFWSGAKDRVKYLTYEEIDRIFDYLEEMYPEGISETEVNDFFWFEEDYIAELLGYKNFEELRHRDDDEDE